MNNPQSAKIHYFDRKHDMESGVESILRDENAPEELTERYRVSKKAHDERGWKK